MLYIFDLDGTLADTMASITHFCNLALKDAGLAPIDQEPVRDMVGNGRDVLIHKLLAYYGEDTPARFERAAVVYDDAYSKDFMYLVKEYEGMTQTLRGLRERGDRLCVCSNKPDDMARAVASGLFSADLFDIVMGHRVGIPHKPDPAAALEIAATLDTQPAKCAFVGDTYVDIETGKNAGMITVGAEWGFRGRRELEEAGADYIIAKPAELLALCL